MGFYSFKTADTKESIANVHSGKEVKTVYLLQPNGLPPIKEENYDGYGNFGVFGGVNCYAWLAKMNFGDATKINAAISADCGNYYEDDDAIYCCKIHLSAQELREALGSPSKPVITFEHYGAPMANGKSANDMNEQGLWERKSIALTYPLKFSFNQNAVYEDLPASESCGYQGYFYPENLDINSVVFEEVEFE